MIVVCGARRGQGQVSHDQRNSYRTLSFERHVYLIADKLCMKVCGTPITFGLIFLPFISFLNHLSLNRKSFLSNTQWHDLRSRSTWPSPLAALP